MVLGTLGIVAVVVVAGVLLDRKFGLITRPEDLKVEKPVVRAKAFGPGEAPSAAIAATTEKQVAALRVRRCAQDRSELVAMEDDRVKYEGKELLVLRWKCPACERGSSLYVSMRG